MNTKTGAEVTDHDDTLERGNYFVVRSPPFLGAMICGGGWENGGPLFDAVVVVLCLANNGITMSHDVQLSCNHNIFA